MHKFDPYSRTNQLIIDGSIFAISFYLAFMIRFEGLMPWHASKQFLLLLPYVVGARLYINWKAGIYRLIWRYVSLSDAIKIARSLSWLTVALLALRLFYPGWGLFSVHVRVPLSVIVLEYLLSLLGCLGARALRRILYQRQAREAWNGAEPAKVLLMGAGAAGVAVARQMALSGSATPIGFLDDDPQKMGMVINGIPVLGPLESLPSVVQRRGVEEVIICLSQLSRSTMKRLWAICHDLPVQMKIIPTLDEILHGKVNIAAFREVRMEELLNRETLEMGHDAPDLAAEYHGKRILITGAGGSIGSELAHQLRGFGPQQLILLDKDENGLFELYSRLGASSDDSRIKPVVADIRFPERLEAIFSRVRPEVVFHAAAHKHVPLMEMNPCEAILNNVVGTRRLVEQSVASAVSRFILISSDKAVSPTSIMGATKRICEMIVQSHADKGSTRFACVRFGNVMGSRGSVIPLFQRQIARGGPVTITHPEVQRFFMTISEAVRLVLQAGSLASSGEIFILDMGDPVYIRELASDLIELSGLRPGRDIQIEVTQLRPGEKMAEQLFDSGAETTTRTRFEKVWVAQPQKFDRTELERKLAALEGVARRESVPEILQMLHELPIGFGTGEALPENSKTREPGSMDIDEASRHKQTLR